MAGFVPNAWAARLLEATVGKTAITTGSMYLGLATEVPSDPLTATLGNITEVSTTFGYARKVIPAFGSATTTSPVKVTTPTAFSFGALTSDMDTAATYAFIADTASGTSGNIRYVFQLEIPVLGRAGEPLNVPASTLIIE